MITPAMKPRRWTPPPAGPDTTPSALTDFRVIRVPGEGAEDVLVRADGSVATGVEDGRILEVGADGKTIRELADTGGRPLGIEAGPEGSLIVCDAHRGLLRVGADGAIESLAMAYQGRRMVFVNNAGVAADGTIYFTDSSTTWSIELWRGDIIEHGATGRLFRRDPDGTLTVLLDGLAFANGVALAADESFVVVAETGAYALRRLWLTGERAGQDEPFGPTLPGFPDNISTGEDGLIWTSVASPRDAALDFALPRHPLLRRAIWALPQALQPNPRHTIRVQAYDDAGALVHDIGGSSPDFHMVTGVRQSGDHVWLGSLVEPAIAVTRIPSAPV